MAEAAEPPEVIGSEADVQWYPLVLGLPFALGCLVAAVFLGPPLLAMAAFYVVAGAGHLPYLRRVARTRLVVSDEGLTVTGPTARAVSWHEIRQVEFRYRKRPGELRWAGLLPSVHLATTKGWGSGHFVTLGILSRVGEAAASATIERAAARHGVAFVAR